MRVRKLLAAFLSVLLLAMSSWAGTGNSSSSSEQLCPCCTKTSPGPTEKLRADRSLVKTQLGQGPAQQIARLAGHIEDTPVWSNSLPQCDHQAGSQADFSAPALREVNRTQFASGPMARAGNDKFSHSFVRSFRTSQETSPPKRTAVDPLSLSLRI